MLRKDKLVGYILLVAGIVLIVLAVYSAYNVFAGSSHPPSLFKMEDIGIQIPSEGGLPPQEMVFIRGDQLSMMVNMGFWFMLMYFVASAGAKIGGLGVKLAREIKVEVKRED